MAEPAHSIAHSVSWARRHKLAVASALVVSTCTGSEINLVFAKLHRNMRMRAQLDASYYADALTSFVASAVRMPADLDSLVPRYRKSILTGPWGHAYQLERTPTGFAIVSLVSEYRRDGPDVVSVERSLPNTSLQMNKERQLP